MRHIYHYQGRQFITDGELAFTHIVLGQRDIEAVRPDIPVARNPGDAHYVPTSAELAVLAKFAFEESRGKFSMKPLAWATSSEDAAALSAKFTKPEWINVSVTPLDPTAVIPHA